ncbi:MAG: hypothetical protein JST62_06430, partial [Bacteroidetes bacterium]|nr:hypothetical protein [Bacteroidota bacterium]
NIYKKEFNDNGFYHPRYINYSFKNNSNVREFVKSFYELIIGEKVNVNIENDFEAFQKKNIDISIVNKNLLAFNFRFEELQNKSHLFKAVFKANNNDILDFRIDVSKGYFAFRSLEKINNSFYELNGKEIYKNLFSKNSEIEAFSWLVYKSFQKYDSHQSIENQIANNLKKLLSNIQ